MTYRTDPFIPQQAETVKEVVAKQEAASRGSWTGREMVAGSDGVWHLLENPALRSSLYLTLCHLRITSVEARTRLDGEPTCRDCWMDRP